MKFRLPYIVMVSIGKIVKMMVAAGGPCDSDVLVDNIPKRISDDGQALQRYQEYLTLEGDRFFCAKLGVWTFRTHDLRLQIGLGQAAPACSRLWASCDAAHHGSAAAYLSRSIHLVCLQYNINGLQARLHGDLRRPKTFKYSILLTS